MVYACRTYFVTMPNAFPPPFMAASKSGFEVLDAVTIDPLASTISAETMLFDAQPY